METFERKYAVGIILDPDNQALLQKKTMTYDWWPGYWCTFGGGVRDQEDPEVAFRREMREEHGLMLSDIELFLEQEFEEMTRQGPQKKRHGKISYFSARFNGVLSNVRLREGAGFALFEHSELVKYNEFGLVVPNNFGAIDKFYEEKIL